MINMQRFKVIDDDLMRPDEQPHGVVPDHVFVEVVLAADAAAAIAAAFQAGMDQMMRGIEQAGYDWGQRDMLSWCIEAIQLEFAKSREPADVHDCLDALRALEVKP